MKARSPRTSKAMREASPNPRSLAQQVPGLTTGDKLSPPVHPKARKGFEPLQPFQPWDGWDLDLRRAFDMFAPQALWVASPDRPVAVGLADRDGNIARWYG